MACSENFYGTDGPLTFRGRAVDIAGNATAWSEPVDVRRLCKRPPCGCDQSPSSSDAAVAGLLAVGAVHRRRRTRTDH